MVNWGIADVLIIPLEKHMGTLNHFFVQKLVKGSDPPFCAAVTALKLSPILPETQEWRSNWLGNRVGFSKKHRGI